MGEPIREFESHRFRQPAAAFARALDPKVPLMGESPLLGIPGASRCPKNLANGHGSSEARNMQIIGKQSSNDKVKVLGGLLRSWGHDAEDFEVEEDQSSELAELFGAAGGVIVVRRRSTGEERLYATGLGSAWFGTLLMDLARGHFAPRRLRAVTLQ